MPQEIMVWHILPAIRRELSKIIIQEHSLTQKKVAKLLGVTEAAISQYLKSKRAKSVVFEQGVLDQIKDSAKVIVKNPDNLIPEIQKICNMMDIKLMVCEVHKKQSKCLPVDCDICLGG